jgi:hypothetical protein
MNTNTTTNRRQAIIIQGLRISADLAMHPGFTKDPDKFALAHKVDLVNPVLPETAFKTDRKTGKKLAKKKANITIGRNKAIHLFVEDNGDGYRLRSIAVEPMELYAAHPESYTSRITHLEAAFKLLKFYVAPLLANPLDADQIIQGHADVDHVSYISQVKISVLVLGMNTACIHNLSHPLTGPAQGASNKRIELCSGDGECSILLENVDWAAHVGSDGFYKEIIRATLTLTGKTLVSQFSPTGKTKSIRGTKRLVWFSTADAAYVFNKLMRQLAGTHLSVPPKWADMGNPVTQAKAIALLAEITSIPVDEIRAMDKEIRNPSKSTHKRLHGLVVAAAACLNPIPVASLFASIEWV